MALLLTVTGPQHLLPGLQNTMVFGPAGGCIGRGHDNDWVLPDPMRYLSVHHARIRCYQGTFYIEDTSTNGVFLNGAARPLGMHASPPLRHGDRLTMGRYEFQVTIRSDRATASAAADADPDALTGDSVEAVLIEETGERRVLSAPPPMPLTLEPAPLPLEEPLTDRRRTPRAAPDAGPELEAFCKGAGIPSSTLPADARIAALQLAGLMLRESLIGARELARLRRALISSPGLNPPPTDQGQDVLNRYSIEELLTQFLLETDPMLPEAIPWLREVFGHARHSTSVHSRDGGER